MHLLIFIIFFFFFNDTATTEIYTLSLHDALPISGSLNPSACGGTSPAQDRTRQPLALSASESSWDWSDTPSVPNSLKCISSVLFEAAPPPAATRGGLPLLRGCLVHHPGGPL